jgi:hypothetical protein
MRQCIAGEQPVKIVISMLPTASVGADKPVSNVLYYLNPGPAAVAMTTVKTAFDTALTAAWAGVMSIKYLAPTITLKDMSTYYSSELVVLPAANGAWVGSQGMDSLPPSACAVITKLSGLTGKPNRGRINLAMVDEDLTLDDGITAAGITLYKALGAAMIATFTAGGQVFSPQIYNESMSDPTLGTTGIWMTRWNAYSLSGVVSNLKRRKPKAVKV